MPQILLDTIQQGFLDFCSPAPPPLLFLHLRSNALPKPQIKLTEDRTTISFLLKLFSENDEKVLEKLNNSSTQPESCSEEAFKLNAKIFLFEKCIQQTIH